MIESIRKRVSVRTYADSPVEESKLSKIRELLRSNTEGPFGNTVRFELIDLTEMEKAEIKTLGTYGFISGAKLYIACAVKDSERATEDIGYTFERVILTATAMDLGTCWLGGTFRRASFAKKMNVSEGEIVPAVSPLGCAHEKRSIKERALRRFAKSDKRKPWGELFFEGDLAHPLTEERAGPYATPLECVRLGPSASNMQPWRIVKESGKDVFHFYLQRKRGYERFVKAVDLQSIDMGIAMCHFELTAIELGLAGKWETRKPDINVGNIEYVITWVP
ncbi:MAG: nitroreductase [Chloroflexi bacterium]|nr:nitroreductase [Chloroflexota bacterium]